MIKPYLGWKTDPETLSAGLYNLGLGPAWITALAFGFDNQCLQTTNVAAWEAHVPQYTNYLLHSLVNEVFLDQTWKTPLWEPSEKMNIDVHVVTPILGHMIPAGSSLTILQIRNYESILTAARRQGGEDLVGRLQAGFIRWGAKLSMGFRFCSITQNTCEYLSRLHDCTEIKDLSPP